MSEKEWIRKQPDEAIRDMLKDPTNYTPEVAEEAVKEAGRRGIKVPLPSPKKQSWYQIKADQQASERSKRGVILTGLDIPIWDIFCTMLKVSIVPVLVAVVMLFLFVTFFGTFAGLFR